MILLNRCALVTGAAAVAGLLEEHTLPAIVHLGLGDKVDRDMPSIV